MGKARIFAHFIEVTKPKDIQWFPGPEHLFLTVDPSAYYDQESSKKIKFYNPHKNVAQCLMHSTYPVNGAINYI